jgi:hypothetical protein
MSYQGISIDIPLGRGGLRTDEEQTKIPLGFLIRAKNIEITDGILQKEPGSRRWSQIALDSGVVALADWHPNDAQSFMVAVERDGKVWRYENPETRIEISAAASAPATLNVSEHVRIVEGGAESAGRAKKLFIFTGNDPVQVISGIWLVLRAIGEPPIPPME